MFRSKHLVVLIVGLLWSGCTIVSEGIFGDTPTPTLSSSTQGDMGADVGEGFGDSEQREPPAGVRVVEGPEVVEVVWSAAGEDITNYEVSIDSGEWVDVGKTTQFVDADALPGAVSIDSFEATRGLATDRIELSAAISFDPGPVRSYRVRSVSASGLSEPSEAVTGARIPERATFTWEREEVMISGQWSTLSMSEDAMVAVTDALSDGEPQRYRVSVTAVGAAARVSSEPAIGQVLAVTELSVGGSHACVLATNGEVACFGRNSSGQLGVGDFEEQVMLAKVVFDGERAEHIAAGGDHTCAVTDAGRVWCWGSNSSGQLGNESRDNRASPVPVDVNGEVVESVSAGVFHTCVVTQQSKIKCWGSNEFGQLGDGGNIDTSRPVDVGISSNRAKSVHCGQAHTCSVLSDGRVLCWGSNENGRLMQRGITESNLPVDASFVDRKAQTLSLGSSHTCALLDDKTMWCWGGNGSGQLGRFLGDDSVDGRDVSLGDDVLSITAGVESSCAVTVSGGASCWGFNLFGQLANGSTDSTSDPTSIDVGAGDVTAIGAGFGQVCVLVDASIVRCWGRNDANQLFSDIMGNRGDEDGEMPPPDIEILEVFTR